MTVIGDQSANALRDVALELEQFRAVLGRLSSNGQPAATAPTMVYVFGTRKAFEPFLPLRNGQPGVARRLLSARRRHQHHRVLDRGIRRRRGGRVPRIQPPAGGHRRAIDSGLAERGARGVLQHVPPEVRRQRRQHRTRHRAARRSCCAQRFIPLSQLLAVDQIVRALQRRRAPVDLLRRVVGADPLPDDGAAVRTDADQPVRRARLPAARRPIRRSRRRSA